MPTYVYECSKCGDEFELWQSFAEEPLKKHPQCGGKVIKVLQPVGIVLKGSGFYKNDSRTTNKNGRSKKSESSPEKSGSASADSSSGSSSDTSSKAAPGGSDSGSSSTKTDGAKSTDKKTPTPKPA
jgi:putative FmdB family regulatory protein